jgi:hypothetical protein
LARGSTRLTFLQKARPILPEMSPALYKRLYFLQQAFDNPSLSTLKPSECEQIATSCISSARILAERRGSGESLPRSLDFISISAPELISPTACRRPKWIQVRCVHGHTKWMRIRCRFCEGCRNAWRGKVRHLISDGARMHRTWFWTLTIKEYPWQVDGDIYDVIQSRWHKLLREADRKEVKFEYFKVVELQERGTPHFHIAVKDFRYRGEAMRETVKVYRILRRLAKMSGFGYRAGKTIDFQAAEHGPAGVAAYMSKYLQKAEDFYRMVRADGRAIRRYSRSRRWVIRDIPCNFRLSRVGSGICSDAQPETNFPCSCGDGFRLNPDHQINRWLTACRKENRWVAPLSMVDYIIKKEKKKWVQESFVT